MENLNAEQVKKALECCATKQFCAFDTPCPWEYMHGGNRLYADALALINSQEQRIKELTEENERLRADNKMVSKRTVRKFVKMLKSHDCRCDSCINEIKKEIENED